VSVFFQGVIVATSICDQESADRITCKCFRDDYEGTGLSRRNLVAWPEGIPFHVPSASTHSLSSKHAVALNDHYSGLLKMPSSTLDLFAVGKQFSVTIVKTKASGFCLVLHALVVTAHQGHHSDAMFTQEEATGSGWTEVEISQPVMSEGRPIKEMEKVMRYWKGIEYVTQPRALHLFSYGDHCCVLLCFLFPQTPQ
jgi:hypothetical protein